MLGEHGAVTIGVTLHYRGHVIRLFGLRWSLMGYDCYDGIDWINIDNGTRSVVVGTQQSYCYLFGDVGRV